jgi:putative transposase
MQTIADVKARLGVAPTCAALGLARASFYRQQRPQAVRAARRPSPRALSAAERAGALAVLHEPRFVDLAPAQVYTRLLDDNRYLCSERTLYRILAANTEVRERRDQLRHPVSQKPELLATAPNQVWSWDISAPQQSSVGDEGGPLASGLQEQIANHRKRLGSKAPVVSIAEKVPEGIR